MLLTAPEPKTTHKTFNRTTDTISWTAWTWNPVTGCKHGCAYCYAREIAGRFPQAFPKGFEPDFRGDRLRAPRHTKIPRLGADTPGIRNVFVCSMADLFGAWVPREWIQAVLDECAFSTRWNFLFLTKNPERYLEFKFPANTWLGASADTQARADRAFEVFHQLPEKTRTFLSCEPLLEPVTFPPGGRVNLVIIGAQSKTKAAPEVQPTWEWVEALIGQADERGSLVHLKTNLNLPAGTKPRREMPYAN